MAKGKEEKELKNTVDEYEELTLEDRVINIEKKVNWTFGLTVVITIISVLLLIFIIVLIMKEGLMILLIYFALLAIIMIIVFHN